MANRGRPFEIGHLKMGGRKAGVPNRKTGEIREFARSLLSDPDYQRSLRERITAGRAEKIESLLYFYAYGRPDAPALQPHVPLTSFTLDVPSVSPQGDLTTTALPSADDDSPCGG